MLTKQQAQALAHFANLCRPDWDERGIMAQLAKVTERHPLDVGMALMRLCGDGNVDNPGAFPNPAGPHWAEKVSHDVNMRRPPRKPEECAKHAGEYRLSCRGCGADRRAARDALVERQAGVAGDWVAGRLTREEAITEMRRMAADARQQTARDAAPAAQPEESADA